VIERYYVLSYASETGGPYRIALASLGSSGGFDGDGLEFNGVANLVGIAERIGEGVKAANPPHFDDIRLERVEQVGPRKVLWPTEDEG